MIIIVRIHVEKGVAHRKGNKKGDVTLSHPQRMTENKSKRKERGWMRKTEGGC